MVRPSDAIRIPLLFGQDPDLIRLQVMTGEAAPLVLGRLIALSMVLHERKATRLFFTEVDQVTSWSGAEPWGGYLIAVGWAIERGFMVELRLPRCLMVSQRHVEAAKVRIKNAKRDAKGRILADPGEPRQRVRPLATVDAEGNLLHGGSQDDDLLPD